MSRRIQVAATAAAVCGSSLLFASPASAWQAGTSNGTLTVAADPGESNRLLVDVAPDGRLLVSDDAGAPRVLGAGCADPDEEGVAYCATAGVSRVVIDTGDLDDTVDVGDIGIPVEVRGGAGNDQLATGAGDDALDGGDGNDTLDSGAGNDALTGGAGDDQLSAGTGNDQVSGGDGTDTIDADLGDDSVSGGAGSDLIDGGPGGDVVHGDDGDDVIDGSDGDDALFGDAGRDRVSGDDGVDRLDGGIGDDDLDGGTGDDVTHGGEGNDTLQATDGADALYGDAGADRLDGDDLANVLSGGSGNDLLFGYGGADQLVGDDGDDALDGGFGSDTVSGGTGSDTLTYESSLLGVRVSLDGLANDGAVNEADNVTDDIETLTGSGSDDVLVAGRHPVRFAGGAGNDTLVGSSAPDVLSGGDGDDVLDGGFGADVLDGGTGTDTVTYASRRGRVLVSVGVGADDGQPGEADDVQSTIERVAGSTFNDTLSAAAGVQVRLDGGPGNDLISLPPFPGGGDDDAVQPRRVSCGTGTDTVAASTQDKVDADCDIVTSDARLVRFAVQGASSPRLRVRVSRVRLLASDALRVPVYCASETGVRCVIGLHVNRGFKSIGRITKSVGRGQAASLDVRLAHSAAQRLRRRGGAVRLTVVVRDKAGAKASGSAIVSVKEPLR